MGMPIGLGRDFDRRYYGADGAAELGRPPPISRQRREMMIHYFASHAAMRRRSAMAAMIFAREVPLPLPSGKRFRAFRRGTAAARQFAYVRFDFAEGAISLMASRLMRFRP